MVLAENGRHSDHAKVTVALQDVNDNAPVFKQNYYRTAVWEGQIPDTYVMQVCVFGLLLLSIEEYVLNSMYQTVSPVFLGDS